MRVNPCGGIAATPAVYRHCGVCLGAATRGYPASETARHVGHELLTTCPVSLVPACQRGRWPALHRLSASGRRTPRAAWPVRYRVSTEQPVPAVCPVPRVPGLSPWCARRWPALSCGVCCRVLSAAHAGVCAGLVCVCAAVPWCAGSDDRPTPTEIPPRGTSLTGQLCG